MAIRLYHCAGCSLGEGTRHGGPKQGECGTVTRSLVWKSFALPLATVLLLLMTVRKEVPGRAVKLLCSHSDHTSVGAGSPGAPGK